MDAYDDAARFLNTRKGPADLKAPFVRTTRSKKEKKAAVMKQQPEPPEEDVPEYPYREDGEMGDDAPVDDDDVGADVSDEYLQGIDPYADDGIQTPPPPPAPAPAQQQPRAAALLSPTPAGVGAKNVARPAPPNESLDLAELDKRLAAYRGYLDQHAKLVRVEKEILNQMLHEPVAPVTAPQQPPQPEEVRRFKPKDAVQSPQPAPATPVVEDDKKAKLKKIVALFGGMLVILIGLYVATVPGKMMIIQYIAMVLAAVGGVMLLGPLMRR